MGVYWNVLHVSILLFPFIALVILLPFLIVQYRRYGSINFLRAVIFYSFILYCVCADFMTVLPLPTLKQLSTMAPVEPNLIPFGFFRGFSQRSGIIWSEPATYLKALISPFSLQYLFNILLLMPLGMYLRYYFRRGFLSTTIITFCTSLFFEITQVTALFGLYPRPYRCFDVDDLICNTLGGIIGFLLIGPMMHFLPSLDKMAESARRKGVHVSVVRRLLAYLIDSGLLLLLNWGFDTLFGSSLHLSSNQEAYPLLFAVAYYAEKFLYFAGFTILFKGYTPGKWVMRFKVVSSKSHTGYGKFACQVLLRYGLLFGYFCIIMNAFDLASTFFSTDSQRMLSIYEYAYTALLGLAVVALVGESIFNYFVKDRDYLWGILSKTRIMATNKHLKRKEKKTAVASSKK
ncbi:MAG: VanZ family protein [Oscillospiraceae bacterium]|nr:VanZ family protein [Oscillospiraceae bacterium]